LLGPLRTRRTIECVVGDILLSGYSLFFESIISDCIEDKFLLSAFEFFVVSSGLE
jgi:hypothetical protein